MPFGDVPFSYLHSPACAEEINPGDGLERDSFMSHPLFLLRLASNRGVTPLRRPCKNCCGGCDAVAVSSIIGIVDGGSGGGRARTWESVYSKRSTDNGRAAGTKPMV
jgi:hypothetical protein